MNADQVSQAIASYLEKVGIKAEVNLLPRASFYEKTDAENLQSSFFMAGWGDSSGEGMVIFNDMLYTYDGKPGMGEGNRGHYSNAEVDALLDQASVETDQAKRAALVEQVDQIARTRPPTFPCSSSTISSACAPAFSTPPVAMTIFWLGTSPSKRA